ncbi:MAG: porin [Betaproteobacteria bacterium]|nr:MAG: porin [Betaproteobacteria bacterium]
MMRVMKHKKTSLAVAAALALGSASAVHAEIGFKAGAWDLSFSGNVNGFATWNSCDNKAITVAGGLACNNVNGGKEQAIESGLLPSALVFGAKTSQSGLDIGVTFGFYPGITSSATGKHGIGASTIDLRQNFLTFGTKAGGTVKVGRDIGLFGSDAILADMTLLGVGSGGAFLGGNTTLGRIGIGYIYTDWIPQISYSSPKYGGFQYSAGVFQGMDFLNFSGLASSATMTQHEQPGLQAKGSYEWTGTVGGKAWASAMNQKVRSRGAPTDNAPAGSDVSSQAFDLGAKLNVAGFEGVLYAYSGDGVGTTAIGFDAAAVVGATVEKRKSKGGYVQGTYKIGNFKPGVSYGESRLDLASNESAGSNPTLVKKNKSLVAGLYYSLTQSLNLVGEYIQTKAESQAGADNKDSVIALGAILFF